jgi:hypothetical protein
MLPHSPSLSGCRSWFKLPSPPSTLTETPVPAMEAARQTTLLLS